jgi:OmpA-OmpF porin, OOP family
VGLFHTGQFATKLLKVSIMKKIAIVLLLSAVAVPAVASDMYVGLRAGQAKTNIDNNTFNNSTLTSTNPTGWGVFIGHDFNPNFAFEAEYLNLGEIKAGTSSAKSTGFSLSGIGSIPLNENFSLFGKLGFAMITGSPGGSYTGNDKKSRALTYGLGGQFNLNPSVGIRLGWDKYKFNDTGLSGNASLISVGGLIKF